MKNKTYIFIISLVLFFISFLFYISVRCEIHPMDMGKIIYIIALVLFVFSVRSVFHKKKYVSNTHTTYKIKQWHDGTPMDDSKVDGVTYVKIPEDKGGGYGKIIYK